MKHTFIYYLVMLPLAAVMLVGCDEEEEVLTPGETFVNKFEVPADATGPEAELRRGFYERNGNYLIFNDTLSVLKDDSGKIIKVETVDFEWSLTTSGSDTDICELFEDIDEMGEAASIVEEHILPYINDGDLRPYSVMPFKSIYNKYEEPVLYKKSWRCFGINMEDLMGCDEADRPEEAKEFFKSFFKRLVGSSNELLDPFHEICDEYCSEYISDIFPEWEDGRDEELIYELGFLSYKKSKKPINDKFISRSKDYEAYVDLVFDYTPEEVTEMYGQYEKIMLKYGMMRNIVADEGIKIQTNS